MTRGIKHRRHRNQFHRRTPPGTSPGTLATDPQAPHPRIRVIAYGPESAIEEDVSDVESIRHYLAKWPVVWVNVDGLGDAEVIRQLGQIFGLHRLAMEDVINVHQRAKVEQYDSYYYFVARMAELHDTLETDQLSLFLGRNYVLTFQETAGDCFDPIRLRIRKKGGRLRLSSADYLAYALLDASIDNYFPIIEKYGEQIEVLEDQVVLHPGSRIVPEIHELKRNLLGLRRAVWPLREAVNGLIREPSPLIAQETRLYLRDCYDHTVQIIDLLENYRDIAASLMEVYLSSVSNRLNEIMKFLTIFTTLFIPLNFIAGLYGMNFNTEKSPWNMPELNWFLGYPMVLGTMVAACAAMLFYFRRKGWIGSSDPDAGSTLSQNRLNADTPSSGSGENAK
jgi:magnesium transporter